LTHRSRTHPTGLPGYTTQAGKGKEREGHPCQHRDTGVAPDAHVAGMPEAHELVGLPVELEASWSRDRATIPERRLDRAHDGAPRLDRSPIPTAHGHLRRLLAGAVDQARLG